MKNLTLNVSLAVLFLVTTSMTGCLSFGSVEFDECADPDNCLTIAFETKEDYQDKDENPQRLADEIGKLLGKDVEIYTVQGAASTVEALRFGHADIGFLDGGAAWLAWQNHGLQVLASEQKGDGRSYYEAVAIVHKDSDMAQADLDDDPNTDPFALMEGKTSCHTAALGSAGMLLPMGFLIANGYVEIVGDPDDIDSLRNTVTNHFSEDSSIPKSGIYYKYQGSLRCMAEGKGDIAFVKDLTLPTYCPDDDPQSWCFEGDFESNSDYHTLSTNFGRAPGHPIMYNPEYMTEDEVAALQDAIFALNQSDSGRQIIVDVLTTPGISVTNTTNHLGTYGVAIGGVPGINAYFNAAYSTDPDNDDSNMMLYAGVVVVAVVVGAGLYWRRNSLAGN